VPGRRGGAAPPPFARRYGLDLYLDRALIDDGDLEIRGRRADTAIRVTLDDYLVAERPAVAPLTAAA
jgi:hypothetical protein